MNDAAEAQVTAARAAREFVLLVLGLQSAARRDPRWAVALAVGAADPVILATTLVMIVIARQQAERPRALDVRATRARGTNGDRGDEL